MKTKGLLSTAAVLLALASPASSYAAIHVDGQLGGSFNSDNYGLINTPSFFTSLDLTFGMTELFQLGAIYDHNLLSYVAGGNDALSFYGGLLRIKTFTGIFVDGQAGIVQRGGLSSSFSWGVGGGYAFAVNSWMSLSPRVGYRYVPDSGISRSLIDAAVMLSVRLF